VFQINSNIQFRASELGKDGSIKVKGGGNALACWSLRKTVKHVVLIKTRRAPAQGLTYEKKAYEKKQDKTAPYSGANQLTERKSAWRGLRGKTRRQAQEEKEAITPS